MATLSYDQVAKIEFDDRALAHLQIVIASKFRRSESFNFTWERGPSEGGGRTTIWMHPAIPLVYEFASNHVPPINRDWLEALMQTANTAAGLQLLAEPKGAVEKTAR